MATSRGHWWDVNLEEQSTREVMEGALAALEQIDVHPAFNSDPFCRDETKPYDSLAVERYWEALSQIDLLLKQFRAGLREETGAVQLWPHHFDLSMVWCSGRRLPGHTDPSWADEQMAFGFSTGDELCQPVLLRERLSLAGRLLDLARGRPLAAGSLRGALLPYEVVLQQEDIPRAILSFWGDLQQRRQGTG